MDLSIIEHIDEVDPVDWNRIAGVDNPFTRHEFLVALERHGCVGERYGWLPRHLALRDQGRLAGAVPLYLKFNSYGELVFDWSWASAYERQGLAYYPKLVSAIPYTPATGNRLLAAGGAETVRGELIEGVRQFAEEMKLSSVHWLFPTEQETGQLEDGGLMRRTGCQFHWENPGYGGFDDFLGALNARKRKNIRRERQRVKDAGITLEVRHGGEVTPSEWQVWQHLYESTFERKSGIPTLSSGFFRELGTTLPDSVVMVFARHHGDIVAGALMIRGRSTLYGRHWGAFAHHDSLHFEACYYQGIDYCIRNGIERFEPGAQGEHKVARGFLPTPTWSAHWIAHDGFRAAIARFLDDEADAMNDYMQDLASQSPYRQPD